MMKSSLLKHYIVTLKSKRVAPEKRAQLREKTKSTFGEMADAFAREISAKLSKGDLPGVVAVDKPRSGRLPMVFITATEGGAALIERDERVQTISAG
jgi:hypothetical protein